MLVIPVAYPARDQVRGELPVGCRNGQQLGADHPLAGAALMHVDVRALRADDGVDRPEQQAEPEQVGAGPVEHEERAAGAERVPETGRGALAPRVGAVRHLIAGVRLGQHPEHGRVRARVIVAAKALVLDHPTSLESPAGPAARGLPADQPPRAAASSSRSRQTPPKSRPAASRAIGRMLVSVIPGATLASRKSTSPDGLTMRSLRDRSRSPSATCAVMAASATARAVSSGSRAGA